jgi:hypothetical protein
MRPNINAFFAAIALVIHALLPVPAMAEGSVTTPLKVIVYGGVFTSGVGLRPEQTFAEVLRSKMKSKGFDLSVTNLSEEGRTTQMALDEIDNVIGSAPDMVILELTEADMRLGIPVSIVVDNLQNVAFAMRRKGIYVIMLGLKPAPEIPADYAKTLLTRVLDISSIIPLYPNVLEGISGRLDMTMANGYHLNGRGTEHLVNAISPMVETGLRWKAQQNASVKQQSTF